MSYLWIDFRTIFSNFLQLFLRSNSCCIGKSIGKKLKFKQFQFSSPLINQILSETQMTTKRTWLLESKLILDDSEQFWYVNSNPPASDYVIYEWSLVLPSDEQLELYFFSVSKYSNWYRSSLHIILTYSIAAFSGGRKKQFFWVGHFLIFF